MYDQLKQFGRVKVKEPMARHTTLRIGGPADFFVCIETADKLVELLKFLDGTTTPYVMLGGGSNLLVQDDGYRGVIVKFEGKRCSVQGTEIHAESGCITVDVAQKSIAAGLTGFEWGVGIPGTIGGAVRGNAGAMGGEMKDVVKEVEIYRDGEIMKLGNEDCHFGYRNSIFKHHGVVVLSTTLLLEKGDNKEGMKKVMEFLRYRMTTQPQGHSVGCIFKNVDLSIQHLPAGRQVQNIPEDFLKKGKISAGWLIDQVEMKGARVGNAEVSTKHCNFILNKGNATAIDVLTLIDEIKTKVYDTLGIELEEEIQII